MRLCGPFACQSGLVHNFRDRKYWCRTQEDKKLDTRDGQNLAPNPTCNTNKTSKFLFPVHLFQWWMWSRFVKPFFFSFQFEVIYFIREAFQLSYFHWMIPHNGHHVQVIAAVMRTCAFLYYSILMNFFHLIKSHSYAAKHILYKTRNNSQWRKYIWCYRTNNSCSC